MSAPVVDWIVLVPDHENALPKRMKARPSHLKGLKPRIDSGIWVMGGGSQTSRVHDSVTDLFFRCHRGRCTEGGRR